MSCCHDLSHATLPCASCVVVSRWGGGVGGGGGGGEVVRLCVSGCLAWRLVSSRPARRTTQDGEGEVISRSRETSRRACYPTSDALGLYHGVPPLGLEGARPVVSAGRPPQPLRLLPRGGTPRDSDGVPGAGLVRTSWHGLPCLVGLRFLCLSMMCSSRSVLRLGVAVRAADVSEVIGVAEWVVWRVVLCSCCVRRVVLCCVFVWVSFPSCASPSARRTCARGSRRRGLTELLN